MIVSARSRTRPASGPNTSTIGRAGSGRATKASTSAVLSATMTDRLRMQMRQVPGDEIRRQPRL